MRYLLMLIIFIGGSAAANAQTTGGTNTSGQNKTQTTKKATVRQQRGTGQYHGSRDTTPGSPMGTGGAGGGDMSGSPAASAIATDDQTSKAEVKKDTATRTQGAATRKATNKKRKTVHRATRSNL